MWSNHVILYNHRSDTFHNYICGHFIPIHCFQFFRNFFSIIITTSAFQLRFQDEFFWMCNSVLNYPLCFFIIIFQPPHASKCLSNSCTHFIISNILFQNTIFR
ncbi:unnamed protein product [Brugia timori]|uniref:Uncharacterized protein n=1 Tax=Brugia timori TaxID=42155 RepID=A0A3P7TSZ2_9BILA|nr:unnamed protein product [Brugia timori]